MAERTDAFLTVRMLVVFILCCFIKRRSFCSQDVIGLYCGADELLEDVENHIQSSLWVVRNKSNSKFTASHSRERYLCFILLLCGDIETQPGPGQGNPDLSQFTLRRGMKILHQNVHGLFSNLDGVKILFLLYQKRISTLIHITIYLSYIPSRGIRLYIETEKMASVVVSGYIFLTASNGKGEMIWNMIIWNAFGSKFS